MIPRYDLGCVYKILEDYQRSIMDVKGIPELWGVGGSKNNPCSEMGPKLNLNLYFKKTWHTIGTIEL